MTMDRQPLLSEQYVIRKKELAGKLSLASSRLRAQVSLLKAYNLSREQVQAVENTHSAVRYSERVVNDSVWVLALREAKVPLRTILKVWDIRERIAQDLPTVNEES